MARTLLIHFSLTVQFLHVVSTQKHILFKGSFYRKKQIKRKKDGCDDKKQSDTENQRILRRFHKGKCVVTKILPSILYILCFNLCRSYSNDLLKSLLLRIEFSLFSHNPSIVQCPSQYCQYNAKQRKMISSQNNFNKFFQSCSPM